MLGVVYASYFRSAPVRSSDGRPPYLWRKACRAKEAHAEDSSNTFSLNLGLRSEFDGARDEAGLATYDG